MNSVTPACGCLPKHAHATLNIYFFLLWMHVYAFVLILGLNPGMVPRMGPFPDAPALFGSCLLFFYLFKLFMWSTQ